MKAPTKRDCNGCRQDFYNGHNGLGVKECWSFKTASLVRKLDIPIDLPPPYLHIKPTIRPSCYDGHRMVRVDKDRLTDKGFWK